MSETFTRIGLTQLIIACAFFVLTLCCFSGPAWASELVVGSTADATDADPGDGACAANGGLCTLRAAVQEANALDDGSPGGDKIVVPAGTYALAIEGQGEDASATGDLDVTAPLTIQGAGKASTTLEGGAIDRVLDVRPGARARIEGVTITDSHAGLDAGGGARNRGVLELVRSVVSGNRADFGGGLDNGGGGTLILEESVVSGNAAADGYGGGIYSSGTRGSTSLYVRASTVANNAAYQFGGGVYSSGDAEMVNSTVTNNTADEMGGGVRNFAASLSLENVTLSSNSAFEGSNLANDGPDAVLSNTIVADGQIADNCSGDPVSSVGGNLDSGFSCGFFAPTDLSGSDPLLGSLRDNGGPTPTRALLPGSPASDAGEDNLCPAKDQRGLIRPQDGDEDGTARCDMGAYEALSPPETTITSGPSGPVGSRSVAFSFSSDPDGEDEISFECSLDGGSFEACTSPKEYADLAEGGHTFAVRAVRWGIVSDETPTVMTFSVDTTPPTISDKSPASGATDVPPNTNVVVTFSEDVKPESVTSTTVTLEKQGSETPIPATVTYDPTSKKATLDPSPTEGLESTTVYDVRVKGGSAGIEDPAGNVLAKEATWSFTTADTVAPDPPTVDLDAASDSGNSSTDDITNDATPALTGTAEANSTVKIYDDTTLLGTTTATSAGSWGFTPASALADGVHSFKATATDAAGNTSAASTILDVTVDTSAPDTTIDSGPSDVTGVDPTDFAFSSTDGSSTFECSLDGLAYEDCTSPESYTGLANGSHTFRVRAKDEAGNADASSAQRTFTVDKSAPTIVDKVPAADATGVARDADATVTFSEVVKPATVNASTFTLTKQGNTTPVEATVTYDEATNTATLDPAQDLVPQGTYTATIRGGASGVTDLAGNSLVADSSWSFTAVDDTPSLELVWGKQFGTSGGDYVNSLALGPNGDAHVAGYTRNLVPGSTGTTDDATLGKYLAADGAEAWNKTFGTSTTDVANDVAVDQQGNTYVVGTGDVVNRGSTGGFVIKYDAQGNTNVSSTSGNVWAKQFTGGSVRTVAVDPDNNVYVSVNINSDVYVYKFAPNGATLASKAFGAYGCYGSGLLDIAFGSAVGARSDDPSVYVTGITAGQKLDDPSNCNISTGENGMFLIKFDGALNKRWDKQFGGAGGDSTPIDLAVDPENNAYVTGYTNSGGQVRDPSAASGGLQNSHGGRDAFLFKFSSGGVAQYARQFGTSGDDLARGIAVGPSQVVHVAGRTTGAFDPAKANAGGGDVFLTKRRSGDGSELVTRQFGTAGEDGALGLAYDWSSGKVVLAGTTSGSLFGTPNAGGIDGFVAKVGYKDPASDVDTEAPSAPVIDLVASSDSGSSATDNLTNATTPILSGSAEPTSIIRVKDGSTVLGTATTSTAGAWNFTPASALAEGTHGLTATAADAAGNQSVASAILTVTVDTTFPSATPTTRALASPAQLGASAVPVGVSWPAATDASGIDRYELRQSVDGGATYANVTLSSQDQTNRTYTAMLAPGASTYAFGARALDKAGNGSWSAGKNFQVANYTETASAVTYGAGWTLASGTDFFGGSAKYHGTAGRKATLTFTGATDAGWVTTLGPNRGKAKVSLYQGTTLLSSVTRDAYAASNAFRQMFHINGGLDPAKSYKLEVEVLGTKNASSTGTRVDVDSFVIIR